MPRYKDQERQEIRAGTRQKLLDAATQTFAREGYHQANINAISKTAGFAKGTVYNYFESKQALMLALIYEISTAHLDFIKERVLEKNSPNERLVEFFQAGFAFVSEYLPQAAVMVNNLYGPQAGFKEAMYRAYQPMFALVREDLLAYGIEQGAFRPVEPVSTTGLIMNIYLGTASQISEAGQTWLAADLVADFVQAALVNRRE